MPFALHIDGIMPGEPIPSIHARSAPDGRGWNNISPLIHWSGIPIGTRSLALTLVDHDAPFDNRNANRVGHRVPADAPRRDFHLWLIANIPVTAECISPGGTGGGLKGSNDFGDGGMEQLNAYTGPCPPWNDERVHSYEFTLYATDLSSLRLKEGFSSRSLEKALNGHVLGAARLRATYSMNLKLMTA